ncbi:hypothetical protein PQR33_32840 [Paraburkholderia sediminicola]|uniref:hypothetical protein n=1 Tax=Paraburkholderia sediminicola TaxID=458836 RepID=UPI0038BBD4BD
MNESILRRYIRRGMVMDVDDFRTAGGSAPPLSMTVTFSSTARIAEICYVEPDARVTSAFGKEDGSFTFWHADGKHSSVAAPESPDFHFLKRFARNLYVAVFDHNDRRFSTSMDVPNVLSVTLSFLPTARVSEIRYLEPDGRITLASEFVERLFRFVFSNGNVHVQLLKGSLDISGLRRLATNVREGVPQGEAIDDAD